MRARKVVLCAGSIPDRLGERAFLLKTWGYTVLTAATAKEALASLESLLPPGVDLLLIELPLDGITPEILGDARRVHPDLRTLITSNHKSAYYDAYHADVLLIRSSTAELVERIRALVQRKRGPKKKPVASVGLSVESQKGAAGKGEPHHR